ncbi:hypothetical protein [Lentisalinibacter sediminis]|uniref:hypothetical protein n=1 Tax=Lentisalinibacter sediminis TaxID=2992237 RepID=UPI00386C7C80
MLRSLRLKWMFAVGFVVIVGILLVSTRTATDHKYDSRAPKPAAGDPEPGDGSGRLEPEAVTKGRTESAGGHSEPCLTVSQLERHPVFVRDMDRFHAVSDSGPSIALYRGLTEQQLLEFAAQGDSAAMVVLGAMSVMRAREWPEEQAVPYLMLEDPDLMFYTFNRPLSEEFLGHMARAREWYYRAALHGRVMVLHRVGESLSLEKGGAVELGWIEAEEYDSLSEQEQASLMPSNIFSMLAFEVAPGLKSGPLGRLIADLMSRNDRQRAIVDRLAKRFTRDLDEAGLDPVSVPESTAPAIEDLLDQLCESELDRL